MMLLRLPGHARQGGMLAAIKLRRCEKSQHYADADRRTSLRPIGLVDQQIATGPKRHPHAFTASSCLSAKEARAISRAVAFWQGV